MAISLTTPHLAGLKNNPDFHQTAHLLKKFSSLELNQPSVIKNYHNLLLYYAAFPGNKQILDLATAEIQRIAAVINAASHNKKLNWKKSLTASGMASTELIGSYSRPITGWLLEIFPSGVAYHSSGASKETIRTILQILLPPIEYEKWSQGELGLRARLERISGLHQPTHLVNWLLKLFKDSQLPDLVKEELFQQLNVFVHWKLENDFYNRSFLRCPIQHVYYQHFIKKKVASTRMVKQKIGRPVLFSLTQKKDFINIARASLALQYRETDPVTYADENELELFDMGNGLQIVLMGMIKERRLSLETYVGYMAFKNGVPVSYGGGWIWGRRCKIGVIIYLPFRRGESARIFCQVLRLYHHYFGCFHFIVKPYQFGKGNQEGLKSAAFWFYYKLGFRPTNDTIKKEAEIEWVKLKKDKKYRTPIKQLQHFTTCNVEWKINKKSFPDFDAGKISLLVSNAINKKFVGDRQLAISSCQKSMNKLFRAASLKKDNFYQKEVLANWGLLLLVLGDIEKWSANQKGMLVKLIKLKQAGKERDYVLQLKKHNRLWLSMKEAINKQV